MPDRPTNPLTLSADNRADWNSLRADDNPFLRHEFLAGLESTGCIRQRFGWQAHHIGVHGRDRLLAAAPAYLKFNSHGEFVFDHAWADAHERVGLAYYPKLLVAVPYSPVPGPRLLTGPRADPSARHRLLTAILDECRALGLSSAHISFLGEDEQSAAVDSGFLARFDCQYHWENRGYRDFEDFLDRLNSKRRKEIRRERRRVIESGWSFEWRCAEQLRAEDLDFCHQRYQQAFIDKGNHPALTRAFFQNLRDRMPEAISACFAVRDNERHAMAFFLQSGNTLFGRYWGSTVQEPALHFECCYYQGIEQAIRLGMQRFEPGAQGEHKIARGFLPVITRSAHWIAHPGLRDAIARSLVNEAQWLERYRATVAEHSPFAEREA